MLASCDRDILSLETRRGFFSLEVDEGFEKFLYQLHKTYKQNGIDSDYIPSRLKAIVAHFKKSIKRKRRNV